MARATASHHIPLRLLAICFAVGCSEPAGPGGPEPTAPSLSLSETDVAFSALAGAPAPAARTVAVSNSGDGTLSGLTAVVAYTAGQPTGWLTAALSGTTAPSTLSLTAATNAIAPGSYGATVTVAGTTGGTRTVNVTLAVEAGTAPSIVVTSPTRAAMLMQGTTGDSPVQISGRVCHDAAPITGITVNGAAVTVSGTALCESFDVTQTSAWGMSTITVEAVNAHGRRAEHVQSYLRSPAFQALAATPDVIANGMFVQLNQQAIDDNNPDLDDIAALLTAGMPTAAEVYAVLPTVLTSIDVLEGTVPFCTDQLVVRKTSLSFGAPTIGVTAGSNVLSVSGSVPSLSLGLSVSYTGCAGNTTTVGGTLTGSRLSLQGSAGVTSVGGFQNLQMNVDLADASLNVNTSGFVSAVASALSSLAFPFIVGILESTVSNLFGSELEAVLQEFIDEISLTELDVLVNGRALTAQADRSFGRVGTSHLAIGISPRFTAVAVPGDAPPHGSILAGSAAIPALSETAFELGAGIGIDALNQFAWSAWRAGAFDVADLAAELGAGFTGVTGTATLMLPPVALTTGSGSTLDMQSGELRITGHVAPTAVGLPAGALIPITAYASARLVVPVGWSGTGLETGTITHVVQVQVDAPEHILDDTALRELMGNAAAQLFRNSIADVIAALPLVDLPFMRLDNVTVGRSGSWLTLTGNSVAK
jgi:hypothetical protein